MFLIISIFFRLFICFIHKYVNCISLTNKIFAAFMLAKVSVARYIILVFGVSAQDCENVCDKIFCKYFNIESLQRCRAQRERIQSLLWPVQL